MLFNNICSLSSSDLVNLINIITSNAELESELFSIEQKIKAVTREKETVASDSKDRIELSLTKARLENQKKKHKKM